MPESEYFWAVLCKNHSFHKQQNLFFSHKIRLGETDAYQAPPELSGDLTVRCDECGEEYFYKPKELMRVELECP